MEMALYYPGLGYYTSNKERIGIKGDYCTSPVLSSLFGEMIGKQLEEMWALLGKNEFTVVEYGAGTGILCRNILGYLQQQSPLYEKLNYCIIERNGSTSHKEKTSSHEKVNWYHSINAIPTVCGLYLIQ
jgi:SAM-dependent MidA family methyltransferase